MEFLQEPSKEDLLYWSLLNPPPLEKPALATEGPMADTTIHEHTQSEEWIQGLERQRMAIRIMAKIRTFAIFGHGTSTPRWCPLCFTFDLTSRFFPSCRTQVRMTPKGFQTWPTTNTKDYQKPTKPTHQDIGCNIDVRRPHRPVPIGCCAGPLGLLGGLLLWFFSGLFSLFFIHFLSLALLGGATDFGCHQYEERMQ